jgi:uncharacterized repeat protein (TIGR01451 family)
VVVSDDLPNGTTFVSAGPGCGYDGGALITCTIGTLDTGAAATVHMVVRVGCDSTEVFNHASVKGDQSDPNINDDDPHSANDADVNTVVQGSTCVDVGIEKLSEADGSSVLTYTIGVHNLGSDDATGVTASDTLPAGVQIVSAVASQGSCGAPDADNVLTCTLGTLTTAVPDATITIRAAAQPGCGDLDNVAGVSTTTFDANPDNNYATEHDSCADLTIKKTAFPDVLFADEEVTFTVTVTNTSNTSTEGTDDLTVSDTLPAGTTFLRGSGGNGCSLTDPANSTVTCTAFDLAPGGTVTFTNVVQSGGCIAFINVATVKSDDDPDPDLANNRDQASVSCD